MKTPFFIGLLGLFISQATAQNCDIAQTGVAIYNMSNSAPASTVTVGQNVNFRFSIGNFGTDPGCGIAANTVNAIFDFPAVAGIKPFIYDGPLSFSSGYFTWTYNAATEVLRGTNATAIPNGTGDLNVLVKVKGMVAGKASSKLTISQGGGISDNAGNNISAAQLIVSDAGLLPIKLGSFTGLAEKCNASIKWVTVSEEASFKQFEVEYSPDASVFIKVGVVAGKNIATGTSYDFTYYQLSGSGYYRLKQVDKDGRFEYSQVIRVTTSCRDKAKVMVYPNPIKFDQDLFVNISGRAGKIQGELYDAAGKKVAVYALANSANALSVVNLSAGVYTLYVRSDGEVESFKIVLTR